MKQGDVLSAIIFNCVLDVAFENWKVQLREEGILIHTSVSRLTDTRYADDVLLYAKSLEELQKMTELLVIELQKVGLQLNADKTKILHSSIYDPGADRDYVDINTEFVRVLHGNESHRYLGRLLCLSPSDRIRIELQNRKNHAWASFHKHKKVILNSHVSLAKRVQFFDVCVSPSMLFALVSLPLTRSQIEELDILQRKMLRRIVGWRRIEGEPWEDTMKRMRDRVENARTLYNWTSWSHRFARDQWRFAMHLTATISPMMSTMLRYTSTERHDSEGLYIPRRFVGRPKMKWDYYLQSFFQHSFPDRSSEHWSCVIRDVNCVELERSFIDFSLRGNVES